MTTEGWFIRSFRIRPPLGSSCPFYRLSRLDRGLAAHDFAVARTSTSTTIIFNTAIPRPPLTNRASESRWLIAFLILVFLYSQSISCNPPKARHHSSITRNTFRGKMPYNNTPIAPSKEVTGHVSLPRESPPPHLHFTYIRGSAMYVLHAA
jgi:hypothetical protein